MFEFPDVAVAFFSTFLPEELVKRLDLTKLEARPDHLVDPRLGWCATDLLFETTLDGLPAALYLLFEHQSTVDTWMPYRLLRKTDLVWANALTKDPPPSRLPIVVPMVLTHARDRWWAARDVQDLVGEPGMLPDCLSDKVPRLSYFLFDLRDMTDAQILGLAATASLRLFLLVLRNVRNPKISSMLFQWAELFVEMVEEPSGLLLLRILLTYLVKAVPEMTQETLMRVGKMAGVDPELVEGSLAWKWLEEGREEGREEGARRLLLRLLEKRFGPLPAWVEEKVTPLSFGEVDGLSEQLLDASSLEEVFCDGSAQNAG
jgi:predicted transposase YdaD